MDIIITITEEEKRVLESWLGEGKIQPWLQHAIDNKIRQRVDASVIEHTDRNPKKMTMEDKMGALAGIVLPTKEERDNIPI